MKKLFRVVLILLLATTQALPALAETDTPQGLSLCSDQYRYGSTPVHLTSVLSQVAQNATITFTGTVSNQNTYPVVDATVWAKILHIRSASKKMNGGDVVDAFPVLEHVTLKAGTDLPVTVTWKVPPNTEPGSYEVATFVSASDAFSYSGIAYTDDVLGQALPFSIVGENQGAVRFDKDSLFIGGQPFSRAEFPVEVSEKSTSVPITAGISNTSAVPVKSTITWSVYYIDPLTKEHLISTEKQEFKVHPHASTTVSYEVHDTNHAVYYVEGEIISAKGTKSIIGVRYVRAGINQPRLSVVGLNGSTAFACIESTGSSASENTEIRLSVIPKVWYARLLEALHLSRSAYATYEGEIQGNTYAVTAPLSNMRGDYLVHAEMYQKGSLVDSARIAYTCNDLGTPCDTRLMSIIIILLPLVLLGLLGAGVYVARNMYVKRQIANLPWNVSKPLP